MKYLYDHIKELVKESNIYLTDSERVDSVKDYKIFLNELLTIIDLNITEFEGFEGETRLLKFKIQSTELSIFVRGNTDYIDQTSIIKGINKSLKEIGNKGLFYSFWSGDFGQEIGFLYIENSNIIDKLSQIIAKNDNIGQIDGISGIKHSEFTEKTNKSTLKLVREEIIDSSKIKSYINSDYVILITAFISIMFGTFFEIIIPNLNLLTGVISGLMIGIGIYQINKRI